MVALRFAGAVWARRNPQVQLDPADCADVRGHVRELLLLTRHSTLCQRHQRGTGIALRGRLHSEVRHAYNLTFKKFLRGEMK